MNKSIAVITALITTIIVASCTPQSEEDIITGDTLTISADKKQLIADGIDQVSFTITLDAEDVTDKADIYINNVKTNTTTFTTSTAGNYEVYASYAGKLSNKIILKAAGPNLFPELAADSQENRFEGFRRRVLVTEATGTWCQYCPYMIKGLEFFEESSKHRDDVVIVAAHVGDAISSVASEKVGNYCNMKSYPSCAYNLDKSTMHSNMGAASVNAQYINNAVAAEMSEPASVGIAASVAEDGVTMAVRAKIKIGKTGKYRINAFLIENGLMYYQTGATPSLGFESPTIAHNHVLRAAACENPITGSLLGERSDSWEVGETVEYYATFDMADCDVTSAENCSVVVFVTMANAYDRYYVNNVITCSPEEQVAFEYSR